MTQNPDEIQVGPVGHVFAVDIAGEREGRQIGQVILDETALWGAAAFSDQCRTTDADQRATMARYANAENTAAGERAGWEQHQNELEEWKCKLCLCAWHGLECEDCSCETSFEG